MRHAEELGRTGVGIAAAGLIGALVATAASVRVSCPAAPPTITLETATRTEPRCDIITHGHYLRTSETTYVADSLSVTGRSGYTPSLEFIDSASVIPRRLHDGFGIRYQAYGMTDSLTWRVVYPHPIRGFENWTHHYGIAAGDHEADVLYDFDYDYEMVPGPWRFEIDIDGQTRCAFTFSVE